MHREVGKWRHGGGIVPSALSKGEQRGRRCLSHNSIIGDLMVYQDRLEWNSKAQPGGRGWRGSSPPL